MEPEIFDVIIIGAGPAGIASAIYAVRKSLKVLILTKTVGGQAANSSEVENYPGFTMITGRDLAKQFRLELLNFENNSSKKKRNNNNSPSTEKRRIEETGYLTN